MPTLKDWWSEISPLLDEALELPGSARESWLEDLERRAPELAAHVRSCLLEVADVADRQVPRSTRSVSSCRPASRDAP